MPINFYNPNKSIGQTKIGVTQINKLVPFKTTNGVYLENPTIKVFNGDRLIKDFSIGDGLELTGTNAQGTEKTLTLTLNGAEFSSYRGKDLEAQCSFFVLGDIEIIFKINVV